MKILVTGARGMLGTDLCRELDAAGHQVHPTDLPDLDVSDPGAVETTICKAQPELVFHLAARTDVDACERKPDAAFKTNTIGTYNVALACQRLDAPLVYVSTIAVFDGTKPEPYTEFDQPNPRSWYSRSKYEGEKTVQQMLRRHFIVRAGWMFGGGTEDKKFVSKILEMARQRPELNVVNDKFGSPTYTRDLSRAMMRLVDTGWYGLYHLVNTGRPASRHEVAQKILEAANITTCRLNPVSSAEFPLPAPRPDMEAGRNLRAELLGLELMRPWEEALRDYVAALAV